MSLLKLRAKDPADLQIVSAVVQDAIAPLCDMTYRAEVQNFIAIVQRLRREPPSEGLERICCALNVQGVVGVQTHGLDLAQKDRLLDLLAVLPEPDSLQLIFADDARIKLTLSNWTLNLEDFGEPWPATCHPCHEVDV